MCASGLGLDTTERTSGRTRHTLFDVETGVHHVGDDARHRMKYRNDEGNEHERDAARRPKREGARCALPGQEAIAHRILLHRAVRRLGERERSHESDMRLSLP